MKYHLVAPKNAAVPWKVEVFKLLCPLQDDLFYWYCEGEQPPSGATGRMTEPDLTWWPIHSSPPSEVYLLLADVQSKHKPEQGTEETT